MTVAEMFSSFLTNLVIQNGESISLRYGELTASLNKRFRDTESKTANSLQVGSFGRKTGINGISDLDMLYILPQSSWDDYKNGGQRRLLEHVRDAIVARYPTTKVRVSRLVVCVTYANFHVEVQPVFELDDRSYKYPDTKDDGAWKITKPREEMEEITRLDAEKNFNLKQLCKMARAWKNKHGLEMGGLLLDTLVYNFLNQTDEYDENSYKYYDSLSHDFFEYLGGLDDQAYYLAPGSGQQVKVRRKFQRKARKAHRLCLEAIEAEETKGVNEKWRKVFGSDFPLAQEETKVTEHQAQAAAPERTWKDTEEFIESLHRVDIRYTLKIDCEVTQNGFLPRTLSEMLQKHFPLLVNKSLKFWVTRNTVPVPYQLKWKVLNRGEAAERRDCVRGQIFDGNSTITERTSFRGDHVVECYAISDGIVVAKDRIHVPIQES